MPSVLVISVCERAESSNGGRMLRAIESALAGYVDRSHDISRVAREIAKPDRLEARDMVDLIANQRAAEACLVVAKVADESTQSLMHVIA